MARLANHLLELRGVCTNPGMCGLMLKRQQDVGAQQPRQHKFTLGQDLVKIDGLNLQYLLATEC